MQTLPRHDHRNTGLYLPFLFICFFFLLYLWFLCIYRHFFKNFTTYTLFSVTTNAVILKFYTLLEGMNERNESAKPRELSLIVQTFLHFGFKFHVRFIHSWKKKISEHMLKRSVFFLSHFPCTMKWTEVRYVLQVFRLQH